MIFNTY